MTQHEVILVLKKANGWMSVEDISKAISINKQTISINLRRLYHTGFIARRLKGHHTWEYNINKRLV